MTESTLGGRRMVTDAALGRLLRLPAARNDYTIAPVRMPMRDGVILRGDHYAPSSGTPRGTILVRTPYGRGLPLSLLNGRIFAARGYHVVIQSVRGTFGSGGTFRPMAQEVEDGPDTVAWLRDQPWFDGRLATLGGSYLGWTQWSALLDPPPELRAAVVLVAPHDFRAAVYGTGSFTLGDFLGWSDQIAHQEDGGHLRRAAVMARAPRRLRPALEGLPLPAAADPVLRGRAPWYREWLSHPLEEDPWWEPYRANAALAEVTAPVLLISGWQDLFLDQTLEQYRTLDERGVEVGLTIGPWTHLDVGTRGLGIVSRETLAWLDQHLAATPSTARAYPVRVHRTGESRWHDLTSWPPNTVPAVFRPHADRTLTLQTPDRPVAGDGTVSFVYDPADPTPALGGRTLTGTMGVRDNGPLEARPDVVTFTTDPLPTAVDVAGRPTLTLAIAVDPPYADVFVRLCDVDDRGRSFNFTDAMLRLSPDGPGLSAPPEGPGAGTTTDSEGPGFAAPPEAPGAATTTGPEGQGFAAPPEAPGAATTTGPEGQGFGAPPEGPGAASRVSAGEVRHLELTLDPCFHRLLAGHRLRLQVSGGAFPRFARNLGLPGAPGEGHLHRPQRHTIHCAATTLTLPVAAAE